VVILLASGGITVLLGTLFWSEMGWGKQRRHEADAAPQVGASQAGERMFLGQVALVPGTSVLRGELLIHRENPGFASGSGEYREVRNVLDINDGAKAGRWLLPDNDHVITEQHDLSPEGEYAPRRTTTVATVALVKVANQDRFTADGELLLLDPTGEKPQ